jgi:LDH2 family malate/lactate/ureidoglycolate dehydrogenase
MITVERLKEFIIDLTKKTGRSEAQARLLADTLIDADLKGIDTHGVLRLILEIDGETVVRIMPDIGFLHTGIEKTC